MSVPGPQACRGLTVMPLVEEKHNGFGREETETALETWRGPGIPDKSAAPNSIFVFSFEIKLGRSRQK